MNGDAIAGWMADFEASHSFLTPFTTKPDAEIAFLLSYAASKKMVASVSLVCCLCRLLSSQHSKRFDIIHYFLCQTPRALSENMIAIIFCIPASRTGAIKNHSTRSQYVLLTRPENLHVHPPPKEFARSSVQYLLLRLIVTPGIHRSFQTEIWSPLPTRQHSPSISSPFAAQTLL
ncbi:hypothetical protein EPI10_002131 [Gossypium australe]|uniref:Uncharacterized protein n=1 Tax=Gossypium australe TaxID=47621 RepID=A0A5B6VDF8_9ROSI|nr:hypothetical protein EPI10_002131 [Gossypium australe]